MKKNMGKKDRMIRILISIAVLVLFVTGAISGPLAIAVSLLAVVMFGFSVAGSCPPYEIFGFSTCKLKK